MRSYFFLLLIPVLTFFACEKNGLVCYHANGNLITEQRTVDHFDGIDLRIGADIHIVQASTYSVKITGSDNLLPIITTEVHGTTLCIETKNNKCINGNSDISIEITTPELSHLIISGSGKITSGRKLVCDDLELNVSGTGDIVLDSLQVNTLSALISGSGDIVLAGQDEAQSQFINVSGTGKIDGVNLSTKTSTIKISGSGDAKVWVTQALDATISGSGDIRYKGYPVVTTSISGTGEVKPY